MQPLLRSILLEILMLFLPKLPLHYEILISRANTVLRETEIETIQNFSWNVKLIKDSIDEVISKPSIQKKLTGISIPANKILER